LVKIVNTRLNEETARGEVMIYSICSCIEEYLTEHNKNSNQMSLYEKMQSRELKEKEIVSKFRSDITFQKDQSNFIFSTN
jgi:hypothetical protein